MLIRPTPKDQQWQAKTPGAFTLQDFKLDWDWQVAACPAGTPLTRARQSTFVRLMAYPA